ncbi:MAG: hypothetical protein K0T99_00110 [Alphaproteobacteria bacterium]|nr:hypothetical protein [Alphaproteobacteria bacterium]
MSKSKLDAAEVLKAFDDIYIQNNTDAGFNKDGFVEGMNDYIFGGLDDAIEGEFQNQTGVKEDAKELLRVPKENSMKAMKDLSDQVANVKKRVDDFAQELANPNVNKLKRKMCVRSICCGIKLLSIAFMSCVFLPLGLMLGVASVRGGPDADNSIPVAVVGSTLAITATSVAGAIYSMCRKRETRETLESKEEKLLNKEKNKLIGIFDKFEKEALEELKSNVNTQVRGHKVLEMLAEKHKEKNQNRSR